MRRWVVLFVALLFASVSVAAVKAPNPVLSRVRALTGGKAKILGTEKAPFGDFYIVFFKGPQGRLGVITVSGDGRYVLLGKILDFAGPLPRDVIYELAKSKGYLKPPQPKKVDMSKIDLKGAPRVGKKEAPAIVLYFDPTFPFCKRELQTLRGMVEKGEIAFYPKYFIVHGPKAKEKAKEAECIRESKGEVAYFDYLLKGKKPSGKLSCNMEQIEKRIDRDIKEAQRLGVRGTPTWVYKGRMYVGYRGEKEIRAVIDKGKSAKVE